MIMSLSSVHHPCRRFPLAEIQSATKDFDGELVIGHGGFGKVYKGHIPSEEADHVVAIKRLDSMSIQGAPEFRAEIEMLSRVRHCHLVSLIGYCDDNNEMILVYEYMPNGTLYHHLHKAQTPLTWVQRMKIAIGAARGLDYLHTGVGTQHGIIHRDVKSSNILLDENWAAMISDFGLSKIGPTTQSLSYVEASVKGTFGYLDPEFFMTRKLTRKTDVYAFGVVLLELLSGRRAVDERGPEEQRSLVRWGQKHVKEKHFDQMIDSNMTGTISAKCLRGFAEIAYRCLLSVVEKRPTMTQVVAKLQELLELQQIYDNSAEPSGIITAFTWKIHKYLVSTTKQNSGGTSSLKGLEKNMNQPTLTDKDGSDDGEVPHQCEEIVASRDLTIFTYSELACATKDFGNHSFLGKGSYGEVYKGWINKPTLSPNQPNKGLLIAIKRLYGYKDTIIGNIWLLKIFSRPNLVKLIGYCLEGEQLFLVYEFMHNGNFEDRLHRGAIAKLPLVKKVKLAVGIARGIVFLNKTRDEIRAYPNQRGLVSESLLHRHKILIDEDFTAKLSDYEYTNDDDCYYHPRFNPLFGSRLQSNLSGFTVVFAEVLTGKHICNKSEFQIIYDWFLQCGKKSLIEVAKLCFQICNEVDSESKMLTVLEEYVKHFPT